MVSPRLRPLSLENKFVLGPAVLLVVLALDGLTLRERCGEADRGLPAAAAPPLRRRLDGDARQPGGQDVLVAPLSAVNIEIVKNQAVRAAVVVRPPTRARRRRSVRARRWNYARALYINDTATLDDIREAVTSLEETARIARRVLGGAHPLTTGIEDELEASRAALGGSSKGSN